MNSTGIICLYDEHGVVADVKHYEYPLKRKYIMEEWRKRYGKLFLKCFVHVCPNVNIEAINIDGTNRREFKGIKNKSKSISVMSTVPHPAKTNRISYKNYDNP